MLTRRRFIHGTALAALASSAGCAGGDPAPPELVWGVHGTRDGWLHKPRAAAFDARDRLFLADLTDRIQVFSRDGSFLRGWHLPGLNVDGPSGVTVDRHGRVLVADTHFYRVLIYSEAGAILAQIGDGVQGSTPGRFGFPTDVVVDRAGNFYVADYGDHDRVQVFTPEGRWVRQWGGHGYEPGEFLKPRALAIDAQDRIYVADSCNHRIQVFATDGTLLRMWGRRGTDPGSMGFPYDLALAGDDTLYVVEYGNARVQRFRVDGTPLGTWGMPGRRPGQLNNPYAVAVDGRGAVSVVDSNNHRVQRFRM